MTILLLSIVCIKLVIILNLLRLIKKKNKKIKQLEYFKDIFINKYTNDTPTITGGKL